jgi:hypothetical protein
MMCLNGSYGLARKNGSSCKAVYKVRQIVPNQKRREAGNDIINT